MTRALTSARFRPPLRRLSWRCPASSSPTTAASGPTTRTATSGSARAGGAPTAPTAAPAPTARPRWQRWTAINTARSCATASATSRARPARTAHHAPTAPTAAAAATLATPSCCYPRRGRGRRSSSRPTPKVTNRRRPRGRRRRRRPPRRRPRRRRPPRRLRPPSRRRPQRRRRRRRLLLPPLSPGAGGDVGVVSGRSPSPPPPSPSPPPPTPPPPGVPPPQFLDVDGGELRLGEAAPPTDTDPAVVGGSVTAAVLVLACVACLCFLRFRMRSAAHASRLGVRGPRRPRRSSSATYEREVMEVTDERVRDAGSKLPQEVRLSLDPAALARPASSWRAAAAAPAEVGATPGDLRGARARPQLKTFAAEPPPACPGRAASLRAGTPKGCVGVQAVVFTRCLDASPCSLDARCRARTLYDSSHPESSNQPYVVGYSSAIPTVSRPPPSRASPSAPSACSWNMSANE